MMIRGSCGMMVYCWMYNSGSRLYARDMSSLIVVSSTRSPNILDIHRVYTHSDHPITTVVVLAHPDHIRLLVKHHCSRQLHPKTRKEGVPTIRRPYKRIPQHIVRSPHVRRLHAQVALPTEHLPDKVAVRHVDDGAALVEAKVDRPLLFPPRAVDAVRGGALDPGVELLPDGHHQVLADVRQC